MKLVTRQIEKPWGRERLPACFGGSVGRRIGEIWFEDPNGSELPLLPKYLFTAERLSIQVHPSEYGPGDPPVARKRAECWYVVDAEEGASVGLGLKRLMNAGDIRATALDGSLPELLEWHPVSKGDFIFVPSGVIHAIGAGLTIVEFQQSADITYRLFDYGRGRPLQLEDALAVAELATPDPSNFIAHNGSEDRVLVSVAQFTVARVASDAGAAWMRERRRWVIPVFGSVAAGSTNAKAGECLLLAAGDELRLQSQSVALIATDAAWDRPLNRR